MGLYDKPQVVNPTLRNQNNTVDSWVDQTAQTMPALNPAAVSGPTQLPPQVAPIAQAHIRQGGQHGNGVMPTGVMPMAPKDRGFEQPDAVNTGIVPPHLNPNIGAGKVYTPPVNAAGMTHLQNMQAQMPAIQAWRAQKPDTTGMTQEQAQAAVQGWFGAQPERVGWNAGSGGHGSGRWPGAVRTADAGGGAGGLSAIRPDIATSGFAASPFNKTGRQY